MPRAKRTRFRLLDALPLEVTFRRVTFRLAVARVDRSGLWQLEARWSGGVVRCAHRASKEALRTDLFWDGLELERATTAHALFERLVGEGRAVRVP